MVKKLVYIIWGEGKYWPDRLLFKTKESAMAYLETRLSEKDFEKKENDYGIVTYTVYNDRGRNIEFIKTIHGDEYKCKSVQPIGQQVMIYKIHCQEWSFEEGL